MVEGRMWELRRLYTRRKMTRSQKAFPVLCMHFKSLVRSHLLFSILGIRAYQSDWWTTAEDCFPLSLNLLLQHRPTPALPVTAERTKISWSCFHKVAPGSFPALTDMQNPHRAEIRRVPEEAETKLSVIKEVGRHVHYSSADTAKCWHPWCGVWYLSLI